MTREEAQELGLYMIEESIKKYGADAIAFRSPCVGKCSWTWQEYYECMKNDVPCHPLSKTTPVDSILRYCEYYFEKHGKEVTKEDVTI